MFVSSKPIIDLFSEGSSYQSKLDSEAKLVMNTHDIRSTEKRIVNLDPDSTYFVAVISVERNQVWGFSETSFTTLPVFEEEPEFNTDEL